MYFGKFKHYADILQPLLDADPDLEWADAKRAVQPAMANDPEAGLHVALVFLEFGFDAPPEEQERLHRHLLDAVHRQQAAGVRALSYRRGSRLSEHESELVWYRAAELGDVEAQRDVGCAYAWEDSVFGLDLEKARYWYGLAAAQGHADALYNWGSMLLAGEGGPQEVDRGLAAIEQAHMLGDRFATQYLSHLLETGPYGIARDEERASGLRRLYEAWATQPTPDPTAELDGRKDPEPFQDAYPWLDDAARTIIADVRAHLNL